MSSHPRIGDSRIDSVLDALGFIDDFVGGVLDALGVLGELPLAFWLAVAIVLGGCLLWRKMKRRAEEAL